jgi:TatD DNase family protein
MWELVRQFPENCFPAMAIHPCDILANFDSQLDWVAAELATGKYWAVGETGIDLYWSKDLLDAQIEAFRWHVRKAIALKLPLIVHVRDSFDAVFAVLDAEKHPDLRGVFHCFTGSLEQAQHAIDLGFYLGIGGVLTFKKSLLPEVVRSVGLSHLILETDAPYLAPMPHRGKRNESAYVPIIGAALVGVLGVEIALVEKTTTENALCLFKLDLV